MRKLYFGEKTNWLFRIMGKIPAASCPFSENTVLL